MKILIEYKLEKYTKLVQEALQESKMNLSQENSRFISNGGRKDRRTMHVF